MLLCEGEIVQKIMWFILKASKVYWECDGEWRGNEFRAN